jgi:hypothetical protein
MSVPAAALVLAWVCIVLLAFGLAGLLWQVRSLQNDLTLIGAQGTQQLIGRRIPEFAGTSPLAVLVVNPGCGACGPMLDAFADLAATQIDRRYEALSHVAMPHRAGVEGVPVRIDEPLVQQLDVPWLPALLLADQDGVIVAGGPVASPNDLRAALEARTAAVPTVAPTLRS